MVAVDRIPLRFVHLINAQIIVCALLATLCSPECTKRTDCSCQGSRMFVDLSKIANQHPGKPLFEDRPTIDPQKDKNKYSYSPCVPFNEGSQMATLKCTGQAACQKVEGQPPAQDQFYGLGPPSSSKFHGDPSTDSFYITYYLVSGSPLVNRTANVNVSCSSDDGRLEVLGEGPKAHYRFILHTRHVCLPGGISVGSILLIVLFVVILAYIIGGFLFLRFYQGARGPEQFPNLEFWKDFPFLVRDGVQFTITGCKGENTYEKI